MSKNVCAGPTQLSSDVDHSETAKEAWRNDSELLNGAAMITRASEPCETQQDNRLVSDSKSCSESDHNYSSCQLSRALASFGCLISIHRFFLHNIIACIMGIGFNLQI